MRCIKILFFLLVAQSSMAKDLGVYGTTFKITEKDLLVVMRENFERMRQGGEIAKFQEDLQRKMEQRVENPKAVENIKKVEESKVRYHDLTFTVSETITNQKNEIIALKGTKINPLRVRTLSSKIIFIDANDQAQKTFIKDLKQKERIKIILVNGNPFELEKEIGQKVYFDQNGKYSEHFNIEAVPTVISQKADKLEIREIFLGEKK